MRLSEKIFETHVAGNSIYVFFLADCCSKCSLFSAGCFEHERRNPCLPHEVWIIQDHLILRLFLKKLCCALQNLIKQAIIAVAQGASLRYAAFWGYFAQQSALLYIKKQPFRRFVQNVQKSAKIIFYYNSLDFVYVRAGVRKNLKLFCKNVLDVSWWL